jgi:hypothetical protein
MKNYTTETIRLRANDALLNSKGFLLFVVCQDGGLEKIGDTTELSAAERNGLEYFSMREEDEGYGEDADNDIDIIIGGNVDPRINI